MEKLMALFNLVMSVNWRNVSVWFRDTFGGAAVTCWLLLHSEKLSELIPFIPDSFKISDFISVLLLAKLMKWCGTLAVLGLIWNRGIDKTTWPQTAIINKPNGNNGGINIQDVPKALAILGVLLLAAGCASKGKVAPVLTPTPAAFQAVATPTPVPVMGIPTGTLSYMVVPGDCLWTIAAKDSVLADPFLWPILYKANRDTISNPDLIEPGWWLQFKTTYTQGEVSAAVKQARDTPPYQRPRP